MFQLQKQATRNAQKWLLSPSHYSIILLCGIIVFLCTKMSQFNFLSHDLLIWNTVKKIKLHKNTKQFSKSIQTRWSLEIIQCWWYFDFSGLQYLRITGNSCMVGCRLLQCTLTVSWPCKILEKKYNKFQTFNLMIPIILKYLSSS